MRSNWKHCEDCRRVKEEYGLDNLIICETCGHLRSPPHARVIVLCGCVRDGPPDWHMLDRYRKSKANE